MWDNAHLVLPRLWLGNKKAALDTDFLRTQHITMVVNCTKDIEFADVPTVRIRMRVPVDDNLQATEIRNLAQWSPEIVYKIVHAYNQGQTILVHCYAGVQRSAAVVAMTLIALRRMTADGAIQFIRACRPIAFFPAVNFIQSIRYFEGVFRQANTIQRRL
jgi:protein-tyrosine phosphatase